MPKLFRWVLLTIVYLASLTVTAVTMFFAATILAGPHSSLLPDWLGSLVLIVGWMIVLVVPVLVTRFVGRKLAAA